MSQANKRSFRVAVTAKLEQLPAESDFPDDEAEVLARMYRVEEYLCRVAPSVHALGMMTEG
jgi:hypothetical protein